MRACRGPASLGPTVTADGCGPDQGREDALCETHIGSPRIAGALAVAREAGMSDALGRAPPSWVGLTPAYTTRPGVSPSPSTRRAMTTDVPGSSRRSKEPQLKQPSRCAPLGALQTQQSIIPAAELRRPGAPAALWARLLRPRRVTSPTVLSSPCLPRSMPSSEWSLLQTTLADSGNGSRLRPRSLSLGADRCFVTEVCRGG
jgi:hypothetical protein